MHSLFYVNLGEKAAATFHIFAFTNLQLSSFTFYALTCLFILWIFFYVARKASQGFMCLIGTKLITCQSFYVWNNFGEQLQSDVRISNILLHFQSIRNIPIKQKMILGWVSLKSNFQLEVKEGILLRHDLTFLRLRTETMAVWHGVIYFHLVVWNNHIFLLDSSFLTFLKTLFESSIYYRRNIHLHAWRVYLTIVLMFMKIPHPRNHECVISVGPQSLPILFPFNILKCLQCVCL